MISEIKNIPLADFLSSLGHEPTVRKGTRLWYKSPLRQEHTPSFKVETTLNCWKDIFIGKGGNIIDLATEMYQSTDHRYLPLRQYRIYIGQNPAGMRRTIGTDSRFVLCPATLRTESRRYEDSAVGTPRTSRIPQRAGYSGTHSRGSLQGGALQRQR